LDDGKNTGSSKLSADPKKIPVWFEQLTFENRQYMDQETEQKYTSLASKRRWWSVSGKCTGCRAQVTMIS
jgi:hypothetical protein